MRPVQGRDAHDRQTMEPVRPQIVVGEPGSDDEQDRDTENQRYDNELVRTRHRANTRDCLCSRRCTCPFGGVVFAEADQHRARSATPCLCGRGLRGNDDPLRVRGYESVANCPLALQYPQPTLGVRKVEHDAEPVERVELRVDHALTCILQGTHPEQRRDQHDRAVPAEVSLERRK